MRRFRVEAHGKIFSTLLRTFLIFLFVFLGFEILGILWGYLISLVVSLVLFILKWGLPKIRNQQGFSPKIIRKFAAHAALSAIGLMFLRNIDVLLVKSLIQDNIQVGFYAAASTLASVPYLLFSSLGVVLLPSISRSIAQNNLPLTKKYLSQSVRFLSLSFTPIAAITAATASGVVSFVYSSAYAEAGLALSLLIFSSLFLVIFMALLTVISGSNKPLLSMLFALFGAAILMIGARIFIPLYGLAGAAYASIIASMVSLLMAGMYVHSKFGGFVSLLSLGRIILSSAIVGLAAYFWQPIGFMILVSYALLLLFYGLLLYLFGELQQEDILLSKDILKKFLRRA